MSQLTQTFIQRLQIPGTHSIYCEIPIKKGEGTAPLVDTSTQVAILNAISDATSARVRSLPALPEKVLAAMKQA